MLTLYPLYCQEFIANIYTYGGEYTLFKCNINLYCGVILILADIIEGASNDE